MNDNDELIEDFDIFKDYGFNQDYSDITDEQWALAEEMMKHIDVSFGITPLNATQLENLEKIVEERDDLRLDNGMIYLTQENRFYID